MITFIKASLKDRALHRWVKRQQDQRALRAWGEAGCPMPPPQVSKHDTIRRIAAKHRINVLIETGTNFGGTLLACLDDFDRLYSIELSDILFAAAKRRLAFSPKVKILHGDSAIVLPQILSELTEPGLFWLDAHYSGEGTARAEIDTPIARELQLIATHPCAQHVVLIDDVRLFSSGNGYLTVEELRKVAGQLWPAHTFSIDRDIAIIQPKMQ